MPLDVSKECFPAPSECHNCLRKRSSLVKRQSEAKKVYKRCSSCHLMTYCDEDCQREHWSKVHRKHCRFLSGKAPVKNSKHDAANCPRCIDQNRTSLTQIRSENSPKTVCYIEKVIVAMKGYLGAAFEFHGEGKTCHCSVEFACQLPFPLGEVSGQYLETARTGLDAMMAHALNILTTMVNKTNEKNQVSTLFRLWRKIICERSILWHDILVREMPFNRTRRHLSDQVDSLQAAFGASPWWKTLKFTVIFIVETSQELVSIYNDSDSMEDSRFQNLKLIDVQYCSTACQKKDLDFHNTVCSTWAKDKSRRILGKERQKHHWKSFFNEK